MFIKKIFEDKIDSLVHLQFQKFGKGTFEERAMIKASRSKDKYTIFTTYEYANELVRIFGEKLGKRKTKVKGSVITTLPLEGKLEFKEKKQFCGIKRYIIEKEMSGEELIALCDKFPTAIMAFSLKMEEDELKIQEKPPKSAKSSTSLKKKTKINFCKVVTKDKNIVNALLFDIPADFKKVIVSHDFIIKELILPKGETDYNKIRELAKRKGKVIRKIEVDGKKLIKEKEFEA